MCQPASTCALWNLLSLHSSQAGGGALRWSVLAVQRVILRGRPCHPRGRGKGQRYGQQAMTSTCLRRHRTCQGIRDLRTKPARTTLQACQHRICTYVRILLYPNKRPFIRVLMPAPCEGPYPPPTSSINYTCADAALELLKGGRMPPCTPAHAAPVTPNT